MKVRKVFTIYDEPYEKIYVPEMTDVLLSSSNLIPTQSNYKIKELNPIYSENGINGVIFVDYSDESNSIYGKIFHRWVNLSIAYRHRKDNHLDEEGYLTLVIR